jgi:ligand-binding sensor domain-containing protein
MRMGEPEEVLGGPVDGLLAEGQVVWAFSSRGVARFGSVDGAAAWTSFSPDTLGGGVTDMARTLGGAVVAATPTGLRLYRSDSADWGDAAPFTAPPSRPIHCIAVDDSGMVYLGTERGLALIDDRGTRWVGPREGIGGTAVIDLLVERGRYLWLGFRSDGLTRIPLESLWRGTP